MSFSLLEVNADRTDDAVSLSETADSIVASTDASNGWQSRRHVSRRTFLDSPPTLGRRESPARAGLQGEIERVPGRVGKGPELLAVAPQHGRAQLDGPRLGGV